MIYIEQLTSKLNDLVSTVNNIISTFNDHTHVVPQGTSKTPLPEITGTANNFDETDYQDEKITHLFVFFFFFCLFVFFFFCIN